VPRYFSAYPAGYLENGSQKKKRDKRKIVIIIFSIFPTNKRRGKMNCTKKFS